MTSTVLAPSAAQAAFDRFVSKAAGEAPAAKANLAAAHMLYLELTPTVRTMFAHYEGHAHGLEFAGPGRNDAEQAMLESIRDRILATRDELARCLAIVILAPIGIDAGSIAPIDYLPLAEIVRARLAA